jgi:hypothetical protein
MAQPVKKSFRAVVEEGAKGAANIPLPFDPDAVWGKKPRHRLSGTIDGQKVRFIIGPDDRELGLKLTPMWRRDAGVEAGNRVSVALWPEGPQRDDLAEDFAMALMAEPKAAAFFDDLAQFYRKAYLTWIDATKKKPEERVRRIKETVKLLKVGKKVRPK